MKCVSRFLRAIFSVKTLVRFLIALACLAVLLVLWCMFVNRLYKHEWQRCKSELEAQGEHLDFEHFIPPPVDDAKNFAMTPLLKPLFDYTRDPKTKEPIFSNPDPPVKNFRIEIKGSNAALPHLNAWQTGNARDLKAWQTYYRASLPSMAHLQSPAEDVLAVLGKFDAPLNELREAMASRPQSRFPLKYEEGFWMSLPQLPVMQQLEKILALRASAELNLHRSDDAFADVQLGFRLIQAIQDEPILIGGLVRLSMICVLIQPIWEGIASHQWTEQQLKKMQAQLQQMDFLSDFTKSIRMERANMIAMLTQFSERHDLMELYLRSEIATGEKPSPKFGYFLNGWFCQNMVIESRCFQEMILSVDEKNQRVDVKRAIRNKDYVESLRPSPLTLLAKLALPVFSQVVPKYFHTQTYLNEAVVACAIERHRLAHGTLPATLDDLHMTGLPHDIINGEPLHYRVTGEDSYLLYSVGWNEKDDGGKIVPKKNGTPDSEQGDWVWSLKPL
jgi:hypothetical protein